MATSSPPQVSDWLRKAADDLHLPAGRFHSLLTRLVVPNTDVRLVAKPSGGAKRGASTPMLAAIAACGWTDDTPLETRRRDMLAYARVRNDYWVFGVCLAPGPPTLASFVPLPAKLLPTFHPARKHMAFEEWFVSPEQDNTPASDAHFPAVDARYIAYQYKRTLNRQGRGGEGEGEVENEEEKEEGETVPVPTPSIEKEKEALATVVAVLDADQVPASLLPPLTLATGDAVATAGKKRSYMPAPIESTWPYPSDLGLDREALVKYMSPPTSSSHVSKWDTLPVLQLLCIVLQREQYAALATSTWSSGPNAMLWRNDMIAEQLDRWRNDATTGSDVCSLAANLYLAAECLKVLAASQSQLFAKAVPLITALRDCDRIVRFQKARVLPPDAGSWVCPLTGEVLVPGTPCHVLVLQYASTVRVAIVSAACVAWPLVPASATITIGTSDSTSTTTAQTKKSAAPSRKKKRPAEVADATEVVEPPKKKAKKAKQPASIMLRSHPDLDAAGMVVCGGTSVPAWRDAKDAIKRNGAPAEDLVQMMRDALACSTTAELRTWTMKPAVLAHPRAFQTLVHYASALWRPESEAVAAAAPPNPPPAMDDSDFLASLVAGKLPEPVAPPSKRALPSERSFKCIALIQKVLQTTDVTPDPELKTAAFVALTQ